MILHSRKFTEMFVRCFSVCVTCIPFIVERTEKQRLAVDCDSRHPVTVCFFPINAFERATASGTFQRVGVILGLRAPSNVAADIVEPVSVPMIKLATAQSGSFCNDTMHVFGFQGWISPAHCIPTAFSESVRPCFIGAPFPLRQEFKINGVHDGEFALREWDQACSVFHVSSLAGRFCFPDGPACLFKFNQCPSTQSTQ